MLSTYINNDFVTYSASEFATKGNIYKMLSERVLTSITVMLDLGQSVKLVIAKVGDVSPYTIEEIVYESPVKVITENNSNRFELTNGLNLNINTNYAFMFVRVDGTSVTTLGIPFEGVAPWNDRDGHFVFEAASRYATTQPQVGDDTFYNTTTNVTMVFATVDPDLHDLLNTGESINFISNVGGTYTVGPDITLSDPDTTQVTESPFVNSPLINTGQFDTVTNKPIWRFATISDNQSNGIDWAVSFEVATSVSFRYMNSNEVGFDYLHVYVDGVEVFNSKNKTVGTWFSHQFVIDAGSHVIRISYQKDNSNSSNDDTVYVSGFGYQEAVGGPFKKNDFIEFENSIYFALNDTTATPDTEPQSWVLFEKGSQPFGAKFWRWTFTSNRLTTIGYISPDVGTNGTYTQADVTYGPAANAFDGSSANFWGYASGDVATGDTWVQIEYSEEKWIQNYSITSRSGSGSQGPDGWILSYSEDGVTWVDVSTETGVPSWGNSETRDFVNQEGLPSVLELPNYTSNHKTRY